MTVTPIEYQTMEPMHDDRRVFPRMKVSGTVHGHRFGTGTEALAAVSIDLRDISISGVSGWANRELTRGDRLHIHFPADGFKRGFNTFGKVVRCDAKATGYSVAIQFDKLLTH